MAESVTKLQVFVASPSDVAEERRRLEAIVGELNRTVAANRSIVLELVKWETHVRGGMGIDAQDVVNRQIEPRDLLIGIFWSRLGTPTERSASGTVEEVQRAIALREKLGETPDIQIYFRGDPPNVQSRAQSEELTRLWDFRDNLPKEIFSRTYMLADFDGLMREAIASYVNGWSAPEEASRHDTGTDPSAQQHTVRRPVLPALPVVRDAEVIERHFVGRSLFLADVENALDGLTSRVGGTKSDHVSRVQAIWYHGFGGMGKSWILRKAMILSETRLENVKRALIDWDDPAWSSLNRAPGTTREMLTPIAERIGQLYGVDRVDEYWIALERVQVAAAARETVLGRFDAALEGLLMAATSEVDRSRPRQSSARRSGSPSPPSGTTRVDAGRVRLSTDIRALQRSLEALGLYTPSPDRSGRDVDRLLRGLDRDAVERQRLLTNWNELLGHRFDDVEATLEPESLLLESLQTAIRACATTQPLLMVFDTCELLSAKHNRDLQALVAPLCDGIVPVIFLFGSRLHPDAGEGARAKYTWRSSIGDERWRLVPFDEDVRFTHEEIELALQGLENQPDDLASTAEDLRAATLGVPLAVRFVLDLADEDETVFAQLGDSSGDDDEADALVERIFLVLADRFLLHLEGKAGRENDLADIVALSLLPDADSTMLSEIWGEDEASERLRELAKHYSLLSGGDLHPTVRSVLRRRWRAGVRPPSYGEALRALLAALERRGPPSPLTSNSFGRDALIFLTIHSWRSRPHDDWWKEFIPWLAMVLAFCDDQKELEGVLRLAAEIRPSSRRLRQAWQDMVDVVDEFVYGWWMYDEWLAEGTIGCIVAERSPSWSDESRASAELLHGLYVAATARSAAERRSAVISLEVAYQSFDGAMPKRAAAAQGLVDLARSIGFEADDWRSRQSEQPTAKKALELALMIDDRHVDARVELAKMAMSGRDYTTALTNLRQAVSFDPDNLNLRLTLADVLRQNREFDAARAEYERVLADDPLDDFAALAHQGLGLVAEEMDRDFDAAETCYRRAMELDIYNADLRLSLAHVLRQKRQFDAARGEYERVLADEPLDVFAAIAHQGLGLVAEEMDRDFEAAEASYRTAVELDADNAYLRLTLAGVLRQKREFDAARGEYERVLADEPRDDVAAIAHQGLGLVAEEKDRDFEAAEASYRTAMELDADNADVRLTLARALRQNREFHAARGEYERVLADEPLDDVAAIAHQGLGLVAEEMDRDFEAAEASYRTAVDLDADNAYLRLTLAGVLRQKREFDAARGEYERVLADEPRDDFAALAHQGLGLVAEEMDRDFEAAEASYRTAMELDADNADVRLTLARALRQNREFDAARGEYERVLADEPRDDVAAIAHQGLGLVAEEMDRDFEAAEASYRTAVELDADNADLRLTLAGVLRQRREFEMARAEYARVLADEPLDDVAALAHQGLGLVAEEKDRDFEAAEASYRTAVELDADNADLRLTLAGALRQGREFDAARGEYERVLADEPLDDVAAIAHQGLGLVAEEMNRDFEAAEASYRTAVELDADNAYLRLTLAGVLRQKRSYDAARAEYERVLADEPLDDVAALAHQGLGLVAEEMDRDFEAAEASYRTAVELDGGSADLRLTLAGALRQGREFDAARGEYERVLADEPLDDVAALAHQGLGLVAEEMDRDFEAAEASYRTAVELDAGNVDLRLTLADVLRRSGRCAEALVEYEHAAGLPFPRASAVVGRAICVAAIGDTERARTIAENADDLAPYYRGEVLGDLAWGLFEAGLSSDWARHVALRAVDLAPRDPEVRLALAAIELDQARSDWREAADAMLAVVTSNVLTSKWQKFLMYMTRSVELGAGAELLEVLEQHGGDPTFEPWADALRLALGEPGRATERRDGSADQRIQEIATAIVGLRASRKNEPGVV